MIKEIYKLMQNNYKSCFVWISGGIIWKSVKNVDVIAAQNVVDVIAMIVSVAVKNS
jgi:hypothetical protein